MLPVLLNLYTVFPLTVVTTGDPVVEDAGKFDLIITSPEPPVAPA
jgi:hypothetical protein